MLPLLMALLLGFGEIAMLVASRAGYQNGADVLADWAAVAMATEPGESWQVGWPAVVADESDRAGCDAEPIVELPDGAHDPGDRVIVRWECAYAPRVVPGWSGLAVVVESGSVVPMPVVVAPPSASPSGS